MVRFLYVIEHLNEKALCKDWTPASTSAERFLYGVLNLAGEMLTAALLAQINKNKPLA